MNITTTDWDVSEYLDNPEMRQAYLKEAIESGDQGLLLSAIGDIAKAKGMSDIAKETGLSRQNLYKALSPNSEPKFSTVQKVLQALGCKLSIA